MLLITITLETTVFGVVGTTEPAITSNGLGDYQVHSVALRKVVVPYRIDPCDYG
jgi:hypothetical protein